MEAFLKDSSKAKGMEILYFENAEIEKFNNKSSVFTGVGPLSVLYFEQYSRFVLQINDWRYPLIRRLPIVSEGKSDSPSYLLPAQNGFSYRLRLDSKECKGTKNFEQILENNSKFSVKGQVILAREVEASPDDNLKRNASNETGLKETMQQNLKQAGEMISTMAQNMKKNAKNLMSSKKAMDLKDIKTKNFRKEVKSTFKKDFFEKSEKRSQKFLTQRKENVNQTEIEEYRDLRTTHVPVHYIPSEQIENLILDNKDLALSESFNLDQISMSDSKQMSGMAGRGRTEVRVVRENQNVNRGGIQQVKGQIETGIEGMTHYHG